MLQTVSSPIGAAVLAKLDAQQVELAMAFVLLVIIIVEHSYKLLVRHNTRKKGKQGMPDVEYDALTTHSGSTSSASSGSTWLEGRYHHLVQGETGMVRYWYVLPYQSSDVTMGCNTSYLLQAVVRDPTA